MAQTTVAEAQARIELSIRNTPNLMEFADPVGHLMKEEMKAAQGGLSPHFLRPLVMVLLYGDDVVIRLLDKLMFETASLRIFMSVSQQKELDAVESAITAIAEGLRIGHIKRKSEVK